MKITKFKKVLFAIAASAILLIPVSANAAAPIQSKYIQGLPHNSYRTGKPEGVVLHETANPNSTIWNEISYMSRNWNSAFVHAFVDKDNIVEVANTDYVSWGSGYQGNQRYIQVELVRHKNKSEVMQSLENYASYVATQLKYYKLGAPDLVDYDGRGNVITHRGVSNLLGGTDHTDPIGYFNQWGISLDYVMGRITYYYNGGKGETAKPSQPTPAQKVFHKGDSVIVKKTATHYAQGQSMASFVKGGQYTVMQEALAYNKSNSKRAYVIGKNGVVTGLVLEQDLQGTAMSAPKPVTPPASNSWKRVAEKGVFTANSTINVRTQPTTSGAVKAQYFAGEAVTYDSYVVKQRYVWISWVSYSGERHYMAVRPVGQSAWGLFR